MPDMGASGFDGLGRLLVGGQVIESPPAPSLAPGTKVASDFFTVNPPTNPATQMVGLVNDAGFQVYNVKNPKWNESSPGKGDGGAKGDGQTDTTGSISAAGTVLTVNNPVFTAADIGKLIFTSHAGVAAGTSNLRIADPLNGCKIVAPFIDSTHVNISVAATVSVAGPRTVTDGAITAGTNVLTSATAVFVNGDNGKVVTVVGAGPGGTNLTAPIWLVVNGTTVNLLDAVASTTVSNASVTVSGALVTWGSDDRLPIQAAIDAANAAGGGRPYGPTGIYCMSYRTTGVVIAGQGGNVFACLLAKNNVWVEGAGQGATVFQAGDKWSGSGANNAIFVENGGNGTTFNWRVLRLTFDGGHVYSLIAAELSQYGIGCSGASNWRMEDCEATNLATKAVYVLGNTNGTPFGENVVLRNNYIHALSGNFIGLNFVNDYIVDGNLMQNGAVDQAECLINQGGSRGLISGNSCRDVGEFRLAGTAGGNDLNVTANYVRILNNPGEIAALTAGSTTQGHRILVADNILDCSAQSQQVVISVNNFTDVTISGNTCLAFGATDICIWVGGNAGNVNFNVVDNRCVTGIIKADTQAVATLTIAGNQVDGGINLGGQANVMVRGNWASGSGIRGTSTTTRCLCVGNFVSCTNATGTIILADQSIIEGNMAIQLGTGNSIGLYGVDSQVRGNTILITNATTKWVNEAAGANYNQIEGNTLLGAGQFNLVGANSRTANNPRFNPQGGVTTPGFPATTVAQQNTTGVDIYAYITNGTASCSCLITGIKANVTVVIPASVLATIAIPAGQSLTPTYAAGAPAWVWYGM